MTDDLAVWLLTQVDADEETYRDPEWWAADLSKRMLAECEAKRRRIAIHQPQPYLDGQVCSTCFDPDTVDDWPEDMRREPWPCATVRAEAEVYVDRPGYRQEWTLT